MRRGPDHPGRPRRAFSLLELVIVLAIVALVVAMAAPRYGSSLARYRADGAARRIAADLDLAGAKARQTSQAKTVVFNITNRTLTISGVADMDHPASDYTVALGDAPYQVAQVTADFGGAPQVTFDGRGMPAAGGTVTIQVGDVQKTILLKQSTGKAEIQ